MKKTFILEELDCANCAVKIEEGIRKIEGIKEVSVNFMTRKMIIELNEENETETIEKIKKAVKKVEPDINIKEIK